MLLYRLQTAFSTLPDLSGWLVTLLLFAGFASVTFMVLRVSGLFTFSPTRLPLKSVLLLVVVAVFTPSLPEEVLYRVLLLPHPTESVSLGTHSLWSGLSLALFVAAHPFTAWSVWHWSRRIFYRPAFLVIVALLGTVCTVAYLYTGSVWAPVSIHWATIVGWKLFFGGPDFNLGKSKGKSDLSSPLIRGD